MCFQGLKVNIVPMITVSLIPRYNEFTHVLIRVTSRSPIHAESESSIDADNIFAISTPIVKGTSWNLRDLTSHRQGVFDKKRKKLNSSCALQKLANSEYKNLSEIMVRNQTLLKPYEKAGPKQKRIMKERNNLA